MALLASSVAVGSMNRAILSQPWSQEAPTPPHARKIDAIIDGILFFSLFVSV
jgi:hypothetical protein